MKGVYSPPDSFLKNKEFDFNILRSYEISLHEFGRQFNPILRSPSGRIQRWVTFHGWYDIAYLMKITNIMCMPTSMSIFATTATHLLGTVTDLKHYQHNVHAYVYVYLRHHCYTFIRNSH